MTERQVKAEEKRILKLYREFEKAMNSGAANTAALLDTLEGAVADLESRKAR